MSGTGMNGAGSSRSGLPAAAPRIPRVHLPYLLLLSLILGLGGAVAMWANLPAPLVVGLFLLQVLVFVLHLLWLFRLFRDAEGVLQGTLAIGSVAVLVISILTFWLVPLWATVFFWILLRTEEKAARQVDAVESAEIGRCAGEVRGLIFAALAYLVVGMVTASQYVEHVNLYTHGQPDEGMDIPLVDALGGEVTIILAVFHLVFVAYYVQVVARAVPALYRAHQLLVSRKWSPSEEEDPR